MDFVSSQLMNDGSLEAFAFLVYDLYERVCSCDGEQTRTTIATSEERVLCQAQDARSLHLPNK
jgi:hypothetical protein